MLVEFEGVAVHQGELDVMGKRKQPGSPVARKDIQQRPEQPSPDQTEGGAPRILQVHRVGNLNLLGKAGGASDLSTGRGRVLGGGRPPWLLG